MEIMQDKTDVLETLVEKAETYGKTNFELLRLRTIDKTANVLSSLISQAVAFILVFMFVAIASIGIALWLGEMLQKTYYGFFYVAGFYGLCGIILIFFKNNWIKKSINNSIITRVLN